MKLIKLFGAASIIAFVGATASFAGTVNTATVNLFGYLQSADVANSGTSTSAIESVVYSLGTAGDGIATWDTETGGGVASDFLSDPRYFQTVTWSGLGLGVGASTSFSGLDIDLIQTLVPLSVTGNVLDNDGSSLVNAFVTVNWADGSFGTANLLESAWETDQQLVITGELAAVPLPASLPILLGGLLLLGGIARRRK